MQSADPRTRVWAEAGLRSTSVEFRPAAHAGIYTLDRLLAIPLLIGAVPVIAGAAFTVWALSRRGPFLAHRRIGQGGAALDVIKLRTMWNNESEDSGVPVPEFVKTEDDPRITSSFARFCRRHSIDELPQLLQVVLGQMSLVGPRPLTRQEMSEHYSDAEAAVTHLRPGISGLWQVRGRNRLNYRQRRRLDLFLVRRYSLALYLRILLATVGSVITGRDAW